MVIWFCMEFGARDCRKMRRCFLFALEQCPLLWPERVATSRLCRDGRAEAQGLDTLHPPSPVRVTLPSPFAPVTPHFHSGDDGAAPASPSLSVSWGGAVSSMMHMGLGVWWWGAV